MDHRRYFTPEAWRRAPVFFGRSAGPRDVEDEAAWFAQEPSPPDPHPMPLPAPAFYFDADTGVRLPVIIVQAEPNSTGGGVIVACLAVAGDFIAILDECEVLSEPTPAWLQALAPELEETA